MVATLEPDVFLRHMTSSGYVVDLKRGIIERIICLSSLVVTALIFSELRVEGRISPPGS